MCKARAQQVEHLAGGACQPRAEIQISEEFMAVCEVRWVWVQLQPHCITAMVDGSSTGNAQQPLMALFDPSAAFRNVIFLEYLCEVLYGQPDVAQLVCRSERVGVGGAVGAGVHAHVFDCMSALLGSALLHTCFAGLCWLDLTG
jgi:hypothetical protein